MERKILPGVIERVPTPAEFDQKQLPQLLLKLVQEIKFEVDEIYKAIGQTEKAAEPWEADADIAKLEALKEAASELAKRVK